MALLGAIGNASAFLAKGGGVLSTLSSTLSLITPSYPKGISDQGAGTEKLLQKLIGSSVGFLFDIPLSTQLTRGAQITDHYVEDNTTLQDHIALEPLRITLSGIVAELVYTKSAAEQYIAETLDKLGPLNLLSPAMSVSAQETLSAANQLKTAVQSTVKQLKNIKSLATTGTPAANNQQAAYAQFSDWLENRTILRVETPWQFFTDMAIEQVALEQDETSQDKSTITVTLKQLRYAQTITTTGSYAPPAAQQSASTALKGNSKGTTQDISSLASWFGV